jgi:hypothetical protein
LFGVEGKFRKCNYFGLTPFRDFSSTIEPTGGVVSLAALYP